MNDCRGKLLLPYMARGGQWIAACRALIRYCPNLNALDTLWQSILQEAQRYTEDTLSRLEAIWQQRYTELI